jgi:hypothetical protein
MSSLPNIQRNLFIWVAFGMSGPPDGKPHGDRNPFLFHSLLLPLCLEWCFPHDPPSTDTCGSTVDEQWTDEAVPSQCPLPSYPVSSLGHCLSLPASTFLLGQDNIFTQISASQRPLPIILHAGKILSFWWQEIPLYYILYSFYTRDYFETLSSDLQASVFASKKKIVKTLAIK